MNKFQTYTEAFAKFRSESNGPFVCPAKDSHRLINWGYTQACPWDIFFCPISSHPMGFPSNYNSTKVNKFMKF